MNKTSPADTTVVIPAFNAEKYLREAINSVVRQTRPAAAIIIVDDGSTDGTPEIAQSYQGVTYVHQANAGVAAALNHGVRLAMTDTIAFLSADDVWTPEKLELQHIALAGQSKTLVFGHMQHFLSPELPPELTRTLACPPDPMPAFSAGTLLAAVEDIRAVGPFNETFQVGEFMDWYGRAKDAGLVTTMLDATVSMRRVHSSNHSTKTLRNQSYAPVLKALIDRRRALQEKS
ncbi:glycosyltransferase family 2 protein [Devosia sp. WQ 349]|uniref:glycosyltransferase family 2 protein n=1 Tax=Devosia sp. WQ 349K1 TaxID=2800329 RepID=UPI001903C542|nr:glycosyltransferase [Devosia sp. WQ 349K1]MBK1795275.1 glycosyltransferase family 2 protein [Devosia sp. WQ 349K1]